MKRELIEFVVHILRDKHYRLHGGLDFIDKIPYLPNGKVDRLKVLHMSYVPDNE